MLQSVQEAQERSAKLRAVDAGEEPTDPGSSSSLTGGPMQPEPPHQAAPQSADAQIPWDVLSSGSEDSLLHELAGSLALPGLPHDVPLDPPTPAVPDAADLPAEPLQELLPFPFEQSAAAAPPRIGDRGWKKHLAKQVQAALDRARSQVRQELADERALQGIPEAPLSEDDIFQRQVDRHKARLVIFRQRWLQAAADATAAQATASATLQATSGVSARGLSSFDLDDFALDMRRLGGAAAAAAAVGNNRAGTFTASPGLPSPDWHVAEADSAASASEG